MIEKMTGLDVKVPPMVAQALGYSGAARYVALYFDAEIGEARFDDGRSDEEANYEAWDVLISHPATRPALEDYDLGDPHGARHFLLIDREGLESGGGALLVGLMEHLSETVRPGGDPRNETATPSKAPMTLEGQEILVARMDVWLSEQQEI